MDFISILSIFVLACFVGYYVVWSVTPALHTPLMSVTNAISSVIVVGALIAAAAATGYEPNPDTADPPAAVTEGQLKQGGDVFSQMTPESARLSTVGSPAALAPEDEPSGWSKWLGLVAVALASVNIFGGFAVTARMLAMYKKKERRDA